MQTFVAFVASTVEVEFASSGLAHWVGSVDVSES
jgi:hypothetical protein